MAKHQRQCAPQWEIGQSVNSTMFPNPVSDVHVNGMGLGRESCPSDLLRGKEPLLRWRAAIPCVPLVNELSKGKLVACLWWRP